MSSSDIQWTNRTWNPLTGCDKYSAGCGSCYALRMSWRLMHIPSMAEKYAGTVYKTKGGKLNWTGKINMHYPSLDLPLREKKPAMWFINSMSDLFHKDVPIQFIAEVFAICYLCPHHTFQILTKRSERLHVLNSKEFLIELHHAINRLHDKHIKPLEQELYFFDEIKAEYPLKNVWLGVSVEDQDNVFRIKDLQETTAHVRFISAEPLLSKVDLDGKLSAIHQVICGGESGGKGVTTCELSWIEGIVSSCKQQQVPVFVKQMGTKLAKAMGMKDNHGGDIEEFPEHLKIRQFPLPAHPAP